MAGITFTTGSPHVSLVAREAAGVRPTDALHRLLRRWDERHPTLPVLPALGGRPRRGALLLAVVLLHPYLLVLALPGTGVEHQETAAAMCRLLAVCALLAAAGILRYAWRIDRRASTGWLAVLLAFLAAQSLPFALLAVEGTGSGRFAYVVGVTQLPLSLVVLALVALAARGVHPPVSSPLTTGLLAGGLAGTTRLVLIDQGIDPSLRLSLTLQAAVTGVVAVVVGAAIVVVLRSGVLPAWARVRVAVFLACLLVGRVLATGQSRQPGTLHTTLSVLVMLAGVAVALGVATRMLQEGINENSRQLAELAHRAARAEVSLRHGRERMHELHATVAGIAQASRLLLADGGPTRNRRRRLEALLDSEMSRLQRMLDRRGAQPVAAVCLDEVLEPLVATQATLGARVRYMPSGLRALGRCDDLAEVVHILLSNAARHAPAAPVTVSAVARGGLLEVRVHDAGPGVPAAVRPTLFTWGGRRPGSPGQGIGLQLAKRLMLEQSGDLTLEDQGRPGGATFLLTIPSCPPGLS